MEKITILCPTAVVDYTAQLEWISAASCVDIMMVLGLPKKIGSLFFRVYSVQYDKWTIMRYTWEQAADL